MTRRALAIGGVIAASLLIPAGAPAHTYGPQDARTVRADQIARDVTDAECPHVTIQRGDLRGLGHATLGCPAGEPARIVIARGVRDSETLCVVLIHERYHVEGWRAEKDEAFRRTDGTLDYIHHRSRRSVMYPVLKARPSVCRR